MSDSNPWDALPVELAGGLITGILAGLGVLGAELFVSRRRSRDEVYKAEFAAIEGTMMTLSSSFRYEQGDLLPDDRQALRRARKLVRAIPAGKSPEVMPGLYFLQSTVEAWEQLRSTVDAINSALLAHRAIRSEMLLEQIERRRRESAANRWCWKHEGWIPILQADLERDSLLRDHVERYQRQWRELEAYREAYQWSIDGYRVDNHLFAVEAAHGAPFNWLEDKRRTWVMNRKLRESAVKHDRAALNIVFAVTSYPFRMPRHLWHRR